MPALSAREWYWIRVLWLLAGAAFTIAHVASKGGGADATAIGGLVFTFSVFILPLLSRIELPGGTKLELRENKQDVEALKTDQAEALDAMSALLVGFTSTITATDAVLAGASDLDSKKAFALLTSLEAITTSLPWFAVGEQVRVLIYAFADADDPNDAGLYFITGNVDDDEAVTVAREFFATNAGGADPIVRCWEQQRIINRAEAAPKERPAVPASQDVGYHGIMTVPLRQADERWGVLVAERKLALRFNHTAERVAAALGNVTVAALAHPALAEEA